MIAITNRLLWEGDFVEYMKKIIEKKPKMLVLREKDLSQDEYEKLAILTKSLCDEAGVPFLIHTHYEVAEKLGCSGVHMSMDNLRKAAGKLREFSTVSVSCHRLDEIKEAEDLGATQIILGNIYETDCKKGLPGKGLDFLHEVCELSSVPVYGIGGINLDRLEEVMAAGAAGGCMMSGFVR